MQLKQVLKKCEKYNLIQNIRCILNYSYKNQAINKNNLIPTPSEES